MKWTFVDDDLHVSPNITIFSFILQAHERIFLFILKDNASQKGIQQCRMSFYVKHRELDEKCVEFVGM